MLFGLSAIAVLWRPDWLDNALFLACWNLIGFSLIVPIGASVLQFGMAPTQLYTSVVPNASVFEYPMILGPAVVVPILLSWNMTVALWACPRFLVNKHLKRL